MQQADWIDIAHPDTLGHLDDHRRVVQNCAHAGADQHIGDLLGPLSRHGQDRQPDVVLAADRLDLSLVHDRQTVERRVELGRVAVEERDDPDALAAKALVARDRLAEVADADERDGPFLGQPEDMLDLAEQLFDILADALFSELH